MHAMFWPCRISCNSPMRLLSAALPWGTSGSPRVSRCWFAIAPIGTSTMPTLRGWCAPSHRERSTRCSRSSSLRSRTAGIAMCFGMRRCHSRSEARLLADGWDRHNELITFVLDAELRARGPEVTLRVVSSDADWASVEAPSTRKRSRWVLMRCFGRPISPRPPEARAYPRGCWDRYECANAIRNRRRTP
jgi:hypothetical protein